MRPTCGSGTGRPAGRSAASPSARPDRRPPDLRARNDRNDLYGRKADVPRPFRKAARMTIVVGYVPTPEGEAALTAALAEAQRRGEPLHVVNSARGDSLVD